MAPSRSKSFKLRRAYDLAFAPDGRLVAAINRDVQFWNTATRKRVLSAHPFSHPSYLDFSADGTCLAVKSTSGHIAILDAASGETITNCANADEGEGASLYFSAGGNSLIDASWDGVLTVRHAATGAIIFHESVGDMVSQITAGADRVTFAYTSVKRPASDTQPPPEDHIIVRRWPFTANQPAAFLASRSFIAALALSPSASRLGVLHGAPPTTLEVLDVATAAALASVRVELGGSGASLAWSPDESMLACVEGRGVSLFHSASLTRTHFIEMPHPASASFSACGGLLGLASWEQGRVLDVADLGLFQLHANAA